MNSKTRLVIIIGVQSMVLLLMIGMKQWTLDTGVPVVLETAPVDPRSLFSGDYVRLNYSIASIRADELGGDREFKRHETIYVLLKEDNPYWKPVAIYHRKPEAPAGEVVIKGEVISEGDQIWNPELKKLEEIKTFRVRYGIENYFVPEGEGRNLERPGNNEKISIRVAVDRYGHAGIKAVLVNGKERYIERLL